jgi:hypothetical protein
MLAAFGLLSVCVALRATAVTFPGIGFGPFPSWDVYELQKSSFREFDDPEQAKVIISATVRHQLPTGTKS